MNVFEELRNDLFKLEDERHRDMKSHKATLITIHPRWFDELAFECGRGELTLRETYDTEFMGIPILRDPKVEKWEISFEPLQFLKEKMNVNGTQ